MNERYDMISDLLLHYQAQARDMTERSQTESAGWSERHRLELYGNFLSNRVEFLLEEINIHAPHLLDELVERMHEKQERAA